MKNLKLLAISLIATLAFTACSDDDAPAPVPVVEEVKSVATVDGKEIDLPYAKLSYLDLGDSSEYYGNTLVFSSVKIEGAVNLESEEANIPKETDALVFIFDSKDKELKPGKYFIGGRFESTEEVFSIGGGIFYKNFQHPELGTQILNGVIKVTVENDVYTITYELLGLNRDSRKAINITGSFKGQISVEEFEGQDE